MPVAGALVWTLIGVCDLFAPPTWLPRILLVGCGSTVYLGALIAPLTGENIFRPSGEKNPFDSLSLLIMVMSWTVFAIAIPFYLTFPNSLPLSVGILTGILWIPISWLLQHWTDIVHGLLRRV